MNNYKIEVNLLFGAGKNRLSLRPFSDYQPKAFKNLRGFDLNLQVGNVIKDFISSHSWRVSRSSVNEDVLNPENNTRRMNYYSSLTLYSAVMVAAVY